MALSHGAVFCSAVCYYGISLSYSLVCCCCVFFWYKNRGNKNNLISDLHADENKYSGSQEIQEGFKQHFEQLSS